MATFLVVGAAKPGIGQAVTSMLHGDGHLVFGTYEPSTEVDAKQFASQFQNVKLSPLDHGSIDELGRFIDSLPEAIDGVVIAQMHFDLRKYDDFSSTEWSRSLAVNLTLPHYLTLRIATRLTAGSSVVTVTSTEGFVGSFGAASYAATKAAVHNLVKSHANVLGATNVRANAIAAGWIGGVMDTDEVFNMSRRITPLGRLGDAAEVAAVARFLLSSDASFITGATIVVDGGYSCVDTISKYEYETV